MHVHTHQLFLLEQYSNSFKSWSAVIGNNTNMGKSLILKSGTICKLWLICLTDNQLSDNLVHQTTL